MTPPCDAMAAALRNEAMSPSSATRRGGGRRADAVEGREQRADLVVLERTLDVGVQLA